MCMYPITEVQNKGIKTTELKGKIENATITDGELNILLAATDGTIEQKGCDDTDLSNTIIVG